MPNNKGQHRRFSDEGRTKPKQQSRKQVRRKPSKGQQGSSVYQGSSVRRGSAKSSSTQPSSKVVQRVVELLVRGFTSTEGYLPSRGVDRKAAAEARTAMAAAGKKNLLNIAASPEPQTIHEIVEKYGKAIQQLNPGCSNTALLVGLALEDIHFANEIVADSSRGGRVKSNSPKPIRRSPRATPGLAMGR